MTFLTFFPGPVNLYAEDHPGAFAPVLHVENIEPVRAGDPVRNLPYLFDDVAGRHCSYEGPGALKQKKWAHAHSVLHPGNPKL
jgi:hypothetical protein